MVTIKKNNSNFTFFKNTKGTYVVNYTDKYGALVRFTASENELKQIIK